MRKENKKKDMEGKINRTLVGKKEKKRTRKIREKKKRKRFIWQT